MTTKNTKSVAAAELRRRAEETFKTNDTKTAKKMAPEKTRLTLHELRVHQIELEMQNEELRQAQVELDAARARYLDLYDLAPVSYVTLSEKGLILEANLTAATLLGVARGALVKQRFTRFILKEDQDIFYRHRKQILETHSAGSGQAGGSQACELRMVKKDGTAFWTGLESTAAQDPSMSSGPDTDGNPMFRIVISDVSERKRAEAEKEKLEAQNRQLQKSESLGRMAGAIAHHFNNQLGTVLGNLELAMMDLPRDGGPVKNLTEAMQATRRAAEVSGLLLTYLGQTSSQHEPLDLSEICRRSLPLLRAALLKDVILESDLPSPGPAVSANANQIQQILTNLVTNAWEAMGEVGGAIQVTVKTVSPDGLPAAHHFPLGWQQQDKAHACLEVRDTGCGITDQDRANLFDPFFSRKFTGRGLGLSVVLGIVRAHGGVVMVESKAGRGSVFRVFLPVSAEEVPRRIEQATETPEMECYGTMLLVEDEEMMRKMGEAMLTRLGFVVLEAKDGLEAVEVFRRHQSEIRCVLCDLTMPRMNGWETLGNLRKLALDIPVILTSGYEETQVIAGDHPEQPQAFLHKPYRLQELRDAIRHSLADKKEGLMPGTIAEQTGPRPKDPGGA
jgi:PAS domain S-box-containing protein